MIWALHGNLGQPEDWGAAATLLAPLRLATPCLWETPPRDFPVWVKSFLATVARGPGQKRVLMGYSLGARLAMHALLEEPGFWAAAIFISGHPGLADEKERWERRRMDLEWAQRLRSGTPLEFATAWNGQEVFCGEAAAQEQLAMLTLHREAMAAAFECWSLGRQADLGERLRSCAVPQLWVAGETDVKFAARARSMENLQGSSAIAILKDCGHRVLLQKPRELAECVRSFLEAWKLEQSDVETSSKL